MATENSRSIDALLGCIELNQQKTSCNLGNLSLFASQNSTEDSNPLAFLNESSSVDEDLAFLFLWNKISSSVKHDKSGSFDSIMKFLIFFCYAINSIYNYSGNFDNKDSIAL